MLHGLNPPTRAAMQSPHIIEATAQNFASEVLERSTHVPVLVDFWADWCAPCRTLMPILAQLAEQFDGSFVLAKVNTEEQQELALHFGVRSLPTVKLFRDGEVVDEFMGALPEAQVRQFLDAHLERQSDRVLAQARALAEAGDLDGALAQAAAVRDEDPENLRVVTGYLELLLMAGRFEEAEAELKTLPANQQESEPAKRVAATVGFARIAAGAAPLADLDSTLAAEPDNSEARYAAAAHRVLQGDYEQAMHDLFEVFKRDRRFGEDAARKALVSVFQLAGDSEAVTDYRRKMFALLH